MLHSRRDFGKMALASVPAVTGLSGAAKPNSVFGGVQVGIITYSFRGLPSTAEETLKYCLDLGINGIEMMSNVAESYAGAPNPMRGFAPGPGPRRPPTPEQQAAMKKAQEEVRAWRTSAGMEKFKALRKMYNQAGVKIYAFKLEPNLSMPDAEYKYIWDVAKTLGANHVTMELPTDDKLLARVASYAEQRKLRIAFHTHGQGGASGFDRALNASKYTALNFDVGHYFGVNGESPVPLVEKYHDRIASLHLKDRAAPSAADKAAAAAGTRGVRGGGNMPWGQGGTPLKEVLQCMKKNRYKFAASIEYEYQTPAGSDTISEIRKCVEYCKQALA